MHQLWIVSENSTFAPSDDLEVDCAPYVRANRPPGAALYPVDTASLLPNIHAESHASSIVELRGSFPQPQGLSRLEGLLRFGGRKSQVTALIRETEGLLPEEARHRLSPFHDPVPGAQRHTAHLFRELGVHGKHFSGGDLGPSHAGF